MFRTGIAVWRRGWSPARRSRERKIQAWLMRLPGGQHPPHPRRILGMPHRRTPIRRHDDGPPARPEHPVNLAQTGVEIGKILEDLHGENGIELGVAIGRSRNIRLATFYQANSAQRCCAAATWSGLMSMAQTRPVGPTNRATSYL